MEPIYHSYLEIPILSFLNGLILLIGFFYSGEYLKNFFKINKIIDEISISSYQNILISTIFFQVILFPLCLYLSISNFILVGLSIAIYLIGLHGIFKKINLIKDLFNFKVEKKVDFILIFTLILGFFLLASAPVTNIDSLDYHLFSAKHLLQNSSFVTDATNFHSSKLFGSGEILISLGLVVGSEQFGSLLQFSGLLSILGILRKFNANYFFYLILLSSPVLVFFISSIKPQLFSACASGFAFTLIFLTNFKNYNFNKFEIKKIIFILIILFANTQVKFSFYLGSFLLIIFLILTNFKTKKIIQLIAIIFLSYILIVMPFLIWKYQKFGGSFFELFYSPFSTDLYGLSYFKMYLTSLSEKNNFWFLIPTSFSNFTQSLGFGSLLIISIFFIKKKIETLKFFTLLFSFIFITYFYGQFTARFFFEIYLWMLIFFAVIIKDLKINIFYNYVLRFQSIIVICVIFYGVVFFTPGIINAKLRDKVLENHALGYKFYKWVNYSLKDTNYPIITFDRAISFSKNYPISRDHLFFVNMSKIEAKPYVDEIISINPKFLVFTDDTTTYKKYINCTTKIFKIEKNLHTHSIRNPFSKSNKKYDAFIYELDPTLMPNCIDPKKVSSYSR